MREKSRARAKTAERKSECKDHLKRLGILFARRNELIDGVALGEMGLVSAAKQTTKRTGRNRKKRMKSKQRSLVRRQGVETVDREPTDKPRPKKDRQRRQEQAGTLA
jgi:hypothetical protein